MIKRMLAEDVWDGEGGVLVEVVNGFNTHRARGEEDALITRE